MNGKPKKAFQILFFLGTTQVPAKEIAEEVYGDSSTKSLNKLEGMIKVLRRYGWRIDKVNRYYSMAAEDVRLLGLYYRKVLNSYTALATHKANRASIEMLVKEAE